MSGKPKLETVAKRAGVSVATASQVMRGTGRISVKTRERVLQAAKDLHYVPDGRAAAMRSGQNREIGFVINQISNPFNAEVISGVSDLLEADGYLLSVLDARDDPGRQSDHIRSFIRNGRGGLLWVPAVETAQETLDLLATQALPTVTFLRRPSLGAFDHVGIRNADATAAATRHLAHLGHRHIAYLGGTDLTAVRQERIAGYRAVMSEMALESPIVWESRDTKPDGLTSMNALLQAHPRTTAVVCNGDMVALGACLALQRDGLAPGRDVSVIGFDDVAEAAIATPPLTSLSVSPYELGRCLARTLLARIAAPAAAPANHDIAARLTVRATCGPPKRA